jgi:hypothetical protein
MNNEYSIFDTRVGRDRRFRLSRTQSQRLWPALPSPGFYPEISGFFEAVGIFLRFLFLKVNLGIFGGFFEKF